MIVTTHHLWMKRNNAAASAPCTAREINRQRRMDDLESTVGPAADDKQPDPTMEQPLYSVDHDWIREHIAMVTQALSWRRAGAVRQRRRVANRSDRVAGYGAVVIPLLLLFILVAALTPRLQPAAGRFYWNSEAALDFLPPPIGSPYIINATISDNPS